MPQVEITSCCSLRSTGLRSRVQGVRAEVAGREGSPPAERSKGLLGVLCRQAPHNSRGRVRNQVTKHNEAGCHGSIILECLSEEARNKMGPFGTTTGLPAVRHEPVTGAHAALWGPGVVGSGVGDRRPGGDQGFGPFLSPLLLGCTRGTLKKVLVGTSCTGWNPSCSWR